MSPRPYLQVITFDPSERFWTKKSIDRKDHFSMGEAEDLRRQAKRALRLADSVSDQYAAQGLKALAAKFLERAQILEQDVMS
jgi:hypothetical protein